MKDDDDDDNDEDDNDDGGRWFFSNISGIMNDRYSFIISGIMNYIFLLYQV